LKEQTNRKKGKQLHPEHVRKLGLSLQISQIEISCVNFIHVFRPNYIGRVTRNGATIGGSTWPRQRYICTLIIVLIVLLFSHYDKLQIDHHLLHDMHGAYNYKPACALSKFSVFLRHKLCAVTSNVFKIGEGGRLHPGEFLFP
jgi:hypothetical protein